MTDVTTHTAPGGVVDIRTGEVVDLRDAAQVAEYLSYIKATKNQVEDINQTLQAAALQLADERAEWTFPAGAGWILDCDPPTKSDVYFDCEVLDELFDRELLPEERRSDLITTRVERRGNTRALHQAARVGGEVAEIIERAEHRKPTRRYARPRRVE